MAAVGVWGEMEEEGTVVWEDGVAERAKGLEAPEETGTVAAKARVAVPRRPQG